MSPEEKEDMGGDYVGAIDQGTTSTRFLIFNRTGEPVASHQVEFRQIYPQSGWHEQDPREIIDSVETCIRKATASFTDQGYSISNIKSVGLSTQRETTVLWDAETGDLLYNAIAWPDTRTQQLVRELKARKGADDLQEICGLPLSTYPSAVKLEWLRRNVPAVSKSYSKGTLVFGTIDTWLLFNLNGRDESFHVTDVTNASRTMYVNLHTLEYDQSVLDFFDIDRSKIKFPRIVSSSHETAFGKFASGPLKGIPISGCLGDQSAALVGQLGFSPGMAKNTYGTGCFLLYNVGGKPVISKHGLLGTVAYQFADQKPVYALEGSIAVAGSAIKFLQNNFGFISSSNEVNELAGTVDDNGGCVFVTAFSGLFAPYWIDDAQGTIFGLTQYTSKGHIARATLEATCFQTKAIMEAMQKDSGKTLSHLAVDGGMSNSSLCMQIQADLIGIPVSRPAMRETTALGAAIMAGYAIGLWKSFDDLKDINRHDQTVFQPQISESERSKLFKRWDKAVQMSRGWVIDEATPA